MESFVEEQESLSSRIEDMQEKLGHDIDWTSINVVTALANVVFTAVNLSEGRPSFAFFTGIAAAVTSGLAINYGMTARSTSETIAALEAVHAQSKLDATRQ